MKPLRWEGLVAYVGNLEVGRVYRSKIKMEDPTYTNDLWVSMLNEFGGYPVGTYDGDDMESTMRSFKNGKRMVEENWSNLLKLMKS